MSDTQKRPAVESPPAGGDDMRRLVASVGALADLNSELRREHDEEAAELAMLATLAEQPDRDTPDGEAQSDTRQIDSPLAGEVERVAQFGSSAPMSSDGRSSAC